MREKYYEKKYKKLKEKHKYLKEQMFSYKRLFTQYYEKYDRLRYYTDDLERRFDDLVISELDEEDYERENTN